eukprot:1160936-Pelagomonas_calceolata.AAC.14
MPLQVVFLAAENAVLIDRTRNRRIDPLTDKVYHMGGNDALSPRIAPVTREGFVDKDAVARYAAGVCALLISARALLVTTLWSVALVVCACVSVLGPFFGKRALLNK